MIVNKTSNFNVPFTEMYPRIRRDLVADPRNTLWEPLGIFNLLVIVRHYMWILLHSRLLFTSHSKDVDREHPCFKTHTSHVFVIVLHALSSLCELRSFRRAECCKCWMGRPEGIHSLCVPVIIGWTEVIYEDLQPGESDCLHPCCRLYKNTKDFTKLQVRHPRCVDRITSIDKCIQIQLLVFFIVVLLFVLELISLFCCLYSCIWPVFLFVVFLQLYVEYKAMCYSKR